VLNDDVPVPEFLDQLAVWKGQTPETDVQWHSIAGGVKDKAELAAKQAEKIPNIREFFLGKAEAERKSQAQALGLRPFELAGWMRVATWATGEGDLSRRSVRHCCRKFTQSRLGASSGG
jgi:hypothetical protein